METYLEKITLDIYDKGKEQIVPFIIAFPAIYSSVAFTPGFNVSSYFDKIAFSVAIEVIFFAIGAAMSYGLYKTTSWGGIPSAAMIYITAVAYWIVALIPILPYFCLFFALFGYVIVALFVFALICFFHPRREK